MIAALLPADVVVVTAPADADPPPLLPAEAACVRGVAEKRRREFTAGRACARAALGRLGVHGYSLVVGPDRAPVWPAGVVGSITHCKGFTGAAVVRRGRIDGIGIDAEGPDPLDADAVDLVCTPTERRWIQRTPDPGLSATLLFSAKEAVHKAIASSTGVRLDFQDVEIMLLRPYGRFSTRVPTLAWLLTGARRLEGHFALSRRHVFTSAVLT